MWFVNHGFAQLHDARVPSHWLLLCGILMKHQCSVKVFGDSFRSHRFHIHVFFSFRDIDTALPTVTFQITALRSRRYEERPP